MARNKIPSLGRAGYECRIVYLYSRPIEKTPEEIASKLYEEYCALSAEVQRNYSPEKMQAALNKHGEFFEAFRRIPREVN